MNTMETIFLVVLSSVALGLFILLLARTIDRRQVKRHEKIKQDHLKALNKELDKSPTKSDKNKKQ